jgi:hypothetical protein
VCDGEDHRVGGLELVHRRELDAVFVARLVGKRHRIVHLHRDAARRKLPDDVGDLRVARVRHVLLERHAEHRRRRRGGAAAEQRADAFQRHALADAVVDAAAGEDHLGVVAGLLGAVREIIRIDADAVAADQARHERQEIPLGARRGEHVAGVDAEHVADRRQLVHEGDVEIALRVLDHFRRFRHFNRRRAVHAGLDHRAVDLGDQIERPGVEARDDLDDGLEAVRLVAGIDALGRIADREILARLQAGDLLQHRDAVFLHGTGIDRRFINHHAAGLERLGHRPRCGEHGREVRPARGVDRRRHRDDEKVASRKRRHIALVAERRMMQVGGLKLAAAVVAGAQLLDPRRVDIEACHRNAASGEGHRHGQADVTQPDHSNLASVRHVDPCKAPAAASIRPRSGAYPGRRTPSQPPKPTRPKPVAEGQAVGDTLEFPTGT